MNAENTNWKIRLQSLLNVAQSELKKTTVIGKKMLSASQSNSLLKEDYEELGQLVREAIHSGELQWNHPRVSELLNQIHEREEELKKLEEDVQKIKQDEAVDSN
jgi:hypothetical protein